MIYGYLGPYLLVDKPKSSSIVGYLNFESSRLKDIQSYIDCALPSIFIPTSDSWLRENKDIWFYKPTRKYPDMLDLTDFTPEKISTILDQFSIYFREEILILKYIFDVVELKFGWFNNIEE